jgi:hypothetical protein
MENVSFFTDELDGVEHAIIEHADGSFTSMTKAHYDKLQAEHFTPNLAD